MRANVVFRNILVIAATLAMGLVLATFANPANAMHPEGVLNEHWDGFAIKGYDPVAYYTMGQALRGSPEFTYEWLDTKWQFASAEHRDMFAADPLTYVPQYGGYCSDVSYTAGKVDVNPTAWRIVNDRLYLFHSEPKVEAWSNDEWELKETQQAWEQVKAGLSQ